MKKLPFIVAVLLACNTLHAQKIKKETLEAKIIPVTYHGVTGKLIDYVEPQGTVNEVVKTQKIGYHPKNDWGLNQTVNPNALPKGGDKSLQKHYTPSSLSKALTYSFDGITNFNVSPADPAVDVGPNHVVQMTNGPSGSYIRVFDKTGTPIGSQVYFDNFMGMPGGLGDPIVLYDERADRWLLSEFSSGGNNMHVAISTTADPSGSYYTYTFNSPGGFPDYPKYSIWENEYIITANVGSPDIFALNRTSLLAGTAASAQTFAMSNFGTIGFQAATPVSLNGTVVPPSGTPAMVMRMRDDAWSGAATDALEIWDIDIDWTTPSNSSMTQNIVLNMNNPFDSELCGYTSFSCIDQPSSSTNLDPLREVLMNRIHYRNFGTHESIVCCHVTDVSGNDDAGVRWYELRRTGGLSGSWSIYQEGTYAPDNDSRWMPTIGISASGNIGLAYNVSSGTTFPSLRYTGRKECDPLNTMTEPETVIVSGTSPNGSNRYGDYNALGLDPVDGETFYMTGMYNPNTGGSTRIGAFSIDPCAQFPEVQFDAVVFDVNEPDATIAESACLDYQIITVPMSIGVAPSQNADITVVVTGGTATSGVDFVLNNPSFTLNGTSLTGTVEVWVYNDNIVEGTENITLGYTLNANGGNAYPGPANQVADITINDDDLDPTSLSVPVTVLSYDFESGFGAFSTVNPSTNTPFQISNVAGTPGGAFDVNPSNTTNFAWVDDDDCDCDQDSVNLVFPSVDLTGFLSANVNFATYFEDNTYQNINENADLYVSVGGGPNQVIGPLVASGVDGPWITQNFDLTPYVGNSNVVLTVNYSDAGGWLYGLAVDDVLITGNGPIGVQTAINSGSGQSADLGPNATVHFYDPATSNVMMTLENTSSFDYGCVTVEVDRAGTSALQFNTTAPADYLHSKTFTVTPTNINPSGTYNVTVYYEEAEVAGWEAATGNNRNNAEIIKVAGANQINDVTPANAASYNITTSGSSLGAFYSDVTFTGAFSTGFSGFGVGVYNPGIPVAPTANFTASTTTTCEGGSITFTDLSGGAPTSWAWDFGDMNTSNQANPTHVYTTAGTYTVTLTVTNAQGSDTETFVSYITITTGVTYAQTFEICPGESVTVGSSTYTSNGTFTDVLTTPEGCDSTITTTVVLLQATSATQDIAICQGASYTIGTSTYTSTGTYTDVLTNAVGCDSTVTTNLTVNPLPTVSIAPASIDPLCTYENPVSLVGTPSGGTFSGPGVSGNTFSPATAGAGTHIITYSYTDGNGCTNTIDLSVQVKDCAGVPEETLEGVSLHPNPNDGTFMISGLSKNTKFQVFDERGRIVLESVVESDETEIKMPVVNNGIYYLRAIKDGKEGGIKFLIAR